MKYINSLRIGLVGSAIALTAVAGCSDDPTSSDQATVAMESKLESSSVSLLKGSSGSAAEVDSLKVNKIRMFVRRLKLERDESDTTGDKNVKTDPFVITFQGQANTFATTTLPAGTYDKVKFEFHKPSNSDVATYLSNPIFVDFVTDGNHTVIYDLTLYKGGVPIAYVWSSDMNANLSMKFDTPVTLAAGSTSTIALKIDPADVFKKGAAVLDPRDKSNESDIDNNIKAAIKLHKH